MRAREVVRAVSPTYGMQVGEWENSLEFDNWGNPLPTASAATVAAWKAAKNEEKMQELDNKSTYPYDLSVRLLRVRGCNSNPCQNTVHAAALILL